MNREENNVKKVTTSENDSNIWSEIRNDFVDDYNICHIDAWVSDSDEETGSVIAYVDRNTGIVIYNTPLAVHDAYAQKVITETARNAKQSADGSSRTSIHFVKKLWCEFGDVPMDPETETLDSGWLLFPKGTFREDIWDWFEETFLVSVATDLMYA